MSQRECLIGLKKLERGLDDLRVAVDEACYFDLATGVIAQTALEGEFVADKMQRLADVQDIQRIGPVRSIALAP